jgi:hypothetical protein
MEPNGQGPGVGVSPDAVITALMNRISNLTMELAMKDAYIAQLNEEGRAVQDSQGHPGMFDQQTLGRKEEVG